MNAVEREPAADQVPIPGKMRCYTVLAESPSTAVVLVGLWVWPQRILFRMLLFGVEAVFPSTPNEIERLRRAGELQEQMYSLRTDPKLIVEPLACDVTMPRSTVREARVWSPGWGTTYGRLQADYEASPLPDVGNALIRVSVAGLSGEVELSGDELRAAAARARPPRSPR
ncbi:hypothetical protein [Parafrankia sp. EUN1f]|uniref:hypothetical protein n=1 Tax=Parafrankia sp. EUN1f TaxID=102897 RepID=UPI0001C45ACE|nr:hypothetical protein [Parafrankia sp. EUN1f]EFC81977.1 hypothetical protein FrEUN1fDRAFT_4927 [Parafrankia sp. EUN1f]